MKITVKDCLGLDAFNPCEVVAGMRNLDNRIRSVSVMDAGDLDTAIKNNGVKEQLVLTSFYAMRGNVALQAEVVKELGKCGVSGIVVFHAKGGVQREDKIIIETAESLGIPFIIIPTISKVEYSDCIEQIMDKMLYGENFRNNLINNTIYHLLNFEKHNSFQSAIKEAAIRNDLQIILLSKDFNPVLVVETRYKATIADAVKTIKEHETSNSGMYSMIDVDGVLAYWGDVTIGKDKYFLMIVDNDDNYSAGEITKLAEIIELAMGMWKYTPERDVKAELIKALIRGNKSLGYSLKDEMNIEGDAIIGVFFAKGIDTPQSSEVILAFEKEHNFEVMQIQEGEETYGLIINKDKGEERDIQKIKASCLCLFDMLKEGNKDVRIFHSTGVDGVEGAADGFRLIGETWSFVEHVFPYKRVFTKYELVLVSSCINIQVQGGYLKKNYAELLEPFTKEMGENKAKQLLETLETFVLDAGMNSAKTSDFMGIHTNTVQYRLKRINEVLGAEITGNRVIPALTIALALKRLERVVN